MSLVEDRLNCYGECQKDFENFAGKPEGQVEFRLANLPAITSYNAYPTTT